MTYKQFYDGLNVNGKNAFDNDFCEHCPNCTLNKCVDIESCKNGRARLFNEVVQGGYELYLRYIRPYEYKYIVAKKVEEPKTIQLSMINRIGHI